MADTVEKGFWEGLPSNIDSKPVSNAQYRSKKSVLLIRLLRAGGMLRTFSTASTRSGHLAAVLEPRFICCPSHRPSRRRI
jgi:hypothetical protein